MKYSFILTEIFYKIILNNIKLVGSRKVVL